MGDRFPQLLHLMVPYLGAAVGALPGTNFLHGLQQRLGSEDIFSESARTFAWKPNCYAHGGGGGGGVELLAFYQRYCSDIVRRRKAKKLSGLPWRGQCGRAAAARALCACCAAGYAKDCTGSPVCF
jgi:hypothetical protein